MTIGLVMLVSGMVTGTNSHTASSLAQLNNTNLQTLAQAGSDQTSGSIGSLLRTSSAALDKNIDTDNTDSDTPAAPAAKSANSNVGLRQEVMNYFSDIPLMAQVSECESHFRQYNSDGSIFRGIVNNADVGVMQINEKYHLQKAKSLGYDIYTVNGNLAYARYLYDTQGAKPWISSSPCWGKFQAAIQTPSKSALNTTTTQQNTSTAAVASVTAATATAPEAQTSVASINANIVASQSITAPAATPVTTIVGTPVSSVVSQTGLLK